MMKLSEKLKLIQQLSGLTQEKLAQHLDVSFPTLNSWVNEKSVPRAQAQKRIDTLYVQYAGAHSTEGQTFSAKQNIVIQKVKVYKDILNFIFNRKDLYDQFALSLTFHTNRIEGSSLTEPETAAILFQNAALSNKSLVEQLEAKNHQTALAYLFQTMTQSKEIEELHILRLHGILMNSINADAGQYRQHGVRIVGANVPTANYMKVPQLMKDVIKQMNKSSDDFIGHIAKVHAKFEQIHPFSDGNGRIGRLIIQAMLIRHNTAPAVISEKKRRHYLAALNKAQRLEDFRDLTELLYDAVLASYLMIEKSV